MRREAALVSRKPRFPADDPADDPAVKSLLFTADITNSWLCPEPRREK
jgi:hypothetical protein